MSTNKIFCFGDGYAHGHIWPEWPQILQALLPDHDIVTQSGVGAGNEFLIDRLLTSPCANSTVIFQWAESQRFDKLIQDQPWKDLALQDPVYFFNFEESPSGTWWLSSATQNRKILEYHDFFVQDQQANLRTHNQKILLENYLQNQRCRYWFTSTLEQETFSRKHALRGPEIQPSPISHFYFVVDCIKPALDLRFEPGRQQKLQTLLQNTVWTPYDPDRQSIWQKICTQIGQ